MSDYYYYSVPKGTKLFVDEKADAVELGIFRNGLLEGWGRRIAFEGDDPAFEEIGAFHEGKLHGVGFRRSLQNGKYEFGFFLAGDHIPDKKAFPGKAEVLEGEGGDGKPLKVKRTRREEDDGFPFVLVRDEYPNMIVYYFGLRDDKYSGADIIYDKEQNFCFAEYCAVENLKAKKAQLDAILGNDQNDKSPTWENVLPPLSEQEQAPLGGEDPFEKGSIREFPKKGKPIPFQGGQYWGSLNKEGLPHGTGLWIKGDMRQYEGGEQYYGDWVNGKREGRGIYEYTWGTATEQHFYEGEWKNDLYHGQGSKRDLQRRGSRYNNYQYTGEFKNGKEDGRGVSFTSNMQGPHCVSVTERYEGEFKEGRRHGHGKISADEFDGSLRTGKIIQEEGLFKEGFAEGEYTIHYGNGTSLQYDNYPKSRAIFTTADGYQIEGYWDYGRADPSTLRLLNPGKHPLLIIADTRSGFDYGGTFVGAFVPVSGETHSYEDMVVLSLEGRTQSIAIEKVDKDSVTYKVPKTFGEEETITIKRGEHKRHGFSESHTARIYDDEYNYSEQYWLDVYCF